VRIVDAHARQKNKRRAFFREQGRNAKTILANATQLHIKDGNIEFRSAADELNGLSCGCDSYHMSRAGKLKDLLDIECDQEFVVQDQTALAPKGRLSVHKLSLCEWNFLFSYELSRAAFKKDIAHDEIVRCR
jgi:hypothetical protein